MDVPAAAAGPWIALGVVLGALALLAVGAVVLRHRGGAPEPAAAPPPPEPRPRDDLADFLAHPPGTPGAPGSDQDGWAALAPAPRTGAPVTPLPAPAPAGAGPGTTLAGLAVAALLLVGVAAALAAAAASPDRGAADRAAPTPPSPPAASSLPATPSAPATGTRPSGSDIGEVAARLSFPGVVLEEHAVGVTVGYPEVELTSDASGTVARLRLPAANCLAATAPPSAGDPGCRAARTEHAELTGRDLRVTRDGEQLTVAGRFATWRDLPGGTAEPTGRSYEVVVTVAPAGGKVDGWRPAQGSLRWDGRLVRTADGLPSTLRSAD